MRFPTVIRGYKALTSEMEEEAGNQDCGDGGGGGDRNWERYGNTSSPEGSSGALLLPSRETPGVIWLLELKILACGACKAKKPAIKAVAENVASRRPQLLILWPYCLGPMGLAASYKERFGQYTVVSPQHSSPKGLPGFGAQSLPTRPSCPSLTA